MVYYKELWKIKESNEYKVNCITDADINSITIEKLNETLELLKYEIIKNMWSWIFIIDFNLFFNIHRKPGCVLEEWNTATVIPFFKRGDAENCNNYRGTGLSHTEYKICAKIRHKRMQE
jgi:hypothetical protein